MRTRLRIDRRELAARLSVEHDSAGGRQCACVVVRVACLRNLPRDRPVSRSSARSAIEPPPPAPPRLKPPPGRPNGDGGGAPRAGAGAGGATAPRAGGPRHGRGTTKHRAAIHEAVLDRHHVEQPRRRTERRRHPVRCAANRRTCRHAVLVRRVSRHQLRTAIGANAARPRELLNEGPREQHLSVERSST